MKRVISFSSFIFVVCISFAANYRVNVTSTLNLRVEPSVESEILCKIQSGEIVYGPDVFETDWVNVNYNGQNGYLMAKYLSPVTEGGKPTLNHKRRPWYYLLDWEGEGYRWMTYVILALSLIMWFELKFIRRLTLDFTTRDHNVKAFRWVNLGLLLAFAALSIVYVYLMGNNAMWFIFDAQQWYFVVLNFIIFVYVFINLVTFFVRTVDDMVAPVQVSLKFGIITWMIGVIGYIICHLISTETGNPINLQIFFVIIGVCQAIQAVIILMKASHAGYVLQGLLAIVAYAVGSVAIVVLLAPMMFMVLIMAIAGLVFLFACKNALSSNTVGISQTASSSSPEEQYNNPSEGHLSWDKEYIERNDGRYVRITNVRSDGTVDTDDGKHWDLDGMGRSKER